MQKSEETRRTRTWARAPGCKTQAKLGLIEAKIFFFLKVKAAAGIAKISYRHHRIWSRKTLGFITAWGVGSNYLEAPSGP